MSLKIGMLVDFMGGGDKTPEDEYQEIENLFKEILEETATFTRDIFPDKLSNDFVDIYVFDFGGLLPGYDSLIESHVSELIRQIEDHPNTLFVIWSNFTGETFKGFLQKEADEYFGEHHNVIISNGMTDELEKRLKLMK